MLTGSDFSVIVQGPIHSSPEVRGDRAGTIRCLDSIRTFLPGAEIILSTWKGAQTKGLDYDGLVESDDPGALVYREDMPELGSNNVNRQIVSTRSGLAVATRKYAVKFRGDLFFESANILDYHEEVSTEIPGGVLRSRILIPPYFTPNPRHLALPFLFHFSDIFQFGRTEDLKTFWSVPLVNEPETTRWLKDRKESFFARYGPRQVRLIPEQYLVLGLVAKSGAQVHFDHPCDISPAKALLSERILLKYFRVVDLDRLGVRFPQRLSVLTHTNYRGADWEKLKASYEKWPTRITSQMGLLFHLYRNLFELNLHYYVRNFQFKAFPPYRLVRNLYRYFFPLAKE